MLLLNYKPVLHQPTGIGVYANAVLPALQTLDHVLIPGGRSGSGTERLQRFAWSQCQLPRVAKDLQADLIFTPAPEGYLGDQVVPQAVMVHDLRPISHPDRSIQSIYFRNWVPLLLKQCKQILTNSNFTASEILRFTGLPESKITVTPLGYDSDHFYPLESIKRLHIRPYLLHVGQPYPHKNLLRLITAFSTIAHRFPDVDLLLLGKPHPSETPRLKRLTSELALTGRVIYKSYVSYQDLPNWYRGALAFVYPSLWEGFGLPILEAMACKCPVITSLGSSLVETAGDSARLIDPYSTDDLANSLTEVISNPAYSKALADSGLLRASLFSWTKCATTLTQSLLNAG